MKLYLVFLLNDQIHYVQNQKVTWPHSKIRTEDGFSKSLTAARIATFKLKLDLRSFSIHKQEYSDQVDFEAFNQQDYSSRSPEEQVSIYFKQQYFKYQRNPQIYMWASYFNNAPLWSDDKNYYYFIKLNEEDLKQANFIQADIDKYREQKQIIEQVVKSKDYLRVDGRKILFFNFKGHNMDRFCPPRPFLDAHSLYNGIFRRPYDNWNTYRITNKEFPSEEILSQTDYIIMPGSGSSAYDNHEWIQLLQEFITTTYEKYPKIKFLCICFGLQIIVKSFGGTVSPCEQRLKNPMFHHTGNCKLEFNLELCNQLKFHTQWKQSTIINQAHGDEVTVLPDLFLHLAYSHQCKYEVIISKDYRILAFQGHPEYSSYIQSRFIAGIVQSIMGVPFEKAKAYQQTTVSQDQDPVNIEICNGFLQYKS